MAFFVAAFALFPLRWVLFSPSEEKPRSLYRLCLLHRALGAMIVAASGLYLLLLVASLPPRAQVDAALDQVLQRGEVALKR